MKKLTAGIFATILGLTTVNAFAATQDGVASTGYVRGAMAAAETAAKAYTDTKVSGVNTALDGYMKVDAFNTFKTENTAAIESAASAAQTAAINTAASDATTKANKALTDAKAYVDQQGYATEYYADTEAADALKDAKAYTDTKVGTLPQGTADVVTYVNTKTEGIASDAELQTLKTTVGGHTTSINNINTALAGKQAALTDAQLNAVDSGITAELVTTYNGYATQIAGAVSDAAAAVKDADDALAEASAATTAANSAVTTAGEAKTAATNAQNAATAAANVAGEAKTSADSAVTVANNAKTAADKATEDVETLTTTVSGHTTTIGEHTTAISNLQTESATKTELQAVDAKFAGYVKVTDIVNEYKPAAN